MQLCVCVCACACMYVCHYVRTRYSVGMLDRAVDYWNNTCIVNKKYMIRKGTVSTIVMVSSFIRLCVDMYVRMFQFVYVPTCSIQ